jgi:hypothetical protein
MSLQARSVTQASRLTRSGRSNCRQAADLIVAAHVLINADGGARGVGATLTPDVGDDQVLSPRESVDVEFRIGLQTLQPFTFFVNVLAIP